PAEVLVEAAQRLARPFDDLLDSEVLAGAAVAHQLESGIDELLHAGLGPGPRRVERSRHGLLAPGGRRGIWKRVRRHDQRAGSTTASRLAAPLSGTLGCRHTSTGNETVTSAQNNQTRFRSSSEIPSSATERR